VSVANLPSRFGIFSQLDIIKQVITIKAFGVLDKNLVGNVNTLMIALLF